jgi:hypothetical protein
MKRLLSILIVFIGTYDLIYAKITIKSEDQRPKWTKATPKPTNDSYEMFMIDASLAETLEGARMVSLKELAKKVTHKSVISDQQIYVVKSNQNGRDGIISDEKYNDTYEMTVRETTQDIHIIYKKIDEYWETITEHGIKTTRLWTLYAVAKREVPQFDNFYSTRYYGSSPAFMSIIPGVGQMYKGSTLKGICMLGGVAACGLGALFCENERSDYKNKMKEQPQFAQTYNTKANNYETARNICIGAAAAIWLYNIIDAAVAKGARRIVVSPNYGSYLSIHPVATPNSAGVSLTYNF